MQASRILPDLQCSLMCEEVRQEINGNLILIGVIQYLRVPQLPITAGRICVFNRWTAGIGQFTESVRIIAPDQTTVVSKGESKFELRDPAMSATSVMFFGNVKFEVAGTYFVEINVDDVMKMRFPLPVVVVPQPGQTPPAAPAAGAAGTP
jgi:hypothetical protein